MISSLWKSRTHRPTSFWLARAGPRPVIEIVLHDVLNAEMADHLDREKSEWLALPFATIVAPKTVLVELSVWRHRRQEVDRGKGRECT